MIKGVNKQIIEVTNTQSPYFEKIVFFVSPTGKNQPSDLFHKEAEKISAKIHKPPRQRITKTQIAYTAVNVALGFGAGGVIMFLLNQFI